MKHFPIILRAALALFAVSSLASTQASAQGPFILPYYRALGTFDCPPGPGYMQVRLAGFYNTWHTQIWMGSHDLCEQQGAVLRRGHAVVLQPSLVSICAGNPELTTLRRWAVDQYGYAIPQTALDYGSREACLAAIYYPGDEDDGGGIVED